MRLGVRTASLPFYTRCGIVATHSRCLSKSGPATCRSGGVMILGSELTRVQGRTKYSRPLYPASRLNVTGIILSFRRCVEMISSRTVSRSPSQAEFEVVIMIAVVTEELHGSDCVKKRGKARAVQKMK
jgi:hypothetical protein